MTNNSLARGKANQAAGRSFFDDLRLDRLLPHFSWELSTWSTFRESKKACTSAGSKKHNRPTRTHFNGPRGAVRREIVRVLNPVRLARSSAVHRILEGVAGSIGAALRLIVVSSLGVH
jgi:hypothetical protein